MEMIYLLENRHDLSTTLPPPQLGSIASILHRDLFSLFIYSQSIFHMAKGYALYILHISILNVTAIVPVVVAWGGTQAAAAAAGYATLLRWTAGIIRSVVSRSGEV
eukprot:scaffold3950_cov70-Phaeocystis_antarctica.AAC.1